MDSARNPLVKAVAGLKERRARERSGLTLVEGAREVGRAVEAGVTLRTLLLCPELRPPNAEDAGLRRAAATAGAEVAVLSRAAFERLSLRQGPDGVAAVVAWYGRALADLAPGPTPLVLVLDGLEKPGNVGALLRTADAAGVDAVLLTGGGTDLGNPNVIRASMGSVFTLAAAACEPAAARAWLRAQALRVVAATPSAESPHWRADYRHGSAIVLGAEHRGLQAAWLDAADERVRIPMHAGAAADSLNVAAAGAVLLFEALRQRQA